MRKEFKHLTKKITKPQGKRAREKERNREELQNKKMINKMQ